MRIAWYTPYSQYSAIGAFSREVIVALQKNGHQVTAVRSEKSKSCVARTEAVQVCPLEYAHLFDKNAEDYLSNFDLVIYNLGNHFANHYYAIEHQRRVPGITILHDYMLHHLLSEWCNEEESRSYLQVLSEEAGEKAVADFQAAATKDIQKDWYMSAATKHPILRFAIANTLGVITHANFYRESTKNLLHCPVATIPLAYPQHIERKMPSPILTSGRLRLLTVGDVNINKRCESIIRALGSQSSIASRWHYRIAGRVTKSYAKHLNHIAATGLAKVDLELLGAVDDQTLASEMKNANAIACLRFPIIEGASASIISSLASGRPTLVSSGGCYDEIPDTLVFRVPIDTETESIQKHLEYIAENYGRTILRAEKAKEWAANRHSGADYAAALDEFLKSSMPEFPLVTFTDQIAKCLSQWKWKCDGPVINEIEAVMTTLFRSSGSNPKVAI